MKTEVGIVDIGLGNIKSVIHLLIKLNFTVRLISSISDLDGLSVIILPGVGAFGDASKKLFSTKLFDGLKQFVSKGGFLLGICLGMQLLFESSQEFGFHKGLGFIEGKVNKFDISLVKQVPHIGWNNVNFNSKEDSFRKLVNNSDFYFVHSYYVLTKEKDFVIATCNYNGFEFPAAVRKGNVFGFQFHPEKSGAAGIKLLKQFFVLVGVKNE